MSKIDDLFKSRKSLDEICSIPEKIISVYSLEKHVWADANSGAARKGRQPELKTIEEFQIDPVRPFLTDILRKMAAPYNPARKDDPIGQGYWIQAEFGSGKSHLLCLLAALALGGQEGWNIVQEKERKAGRGKRESLYQFWEEGLEAKSGKGKKGIFVIVKTLVGVGGGTIGLGGGGQRLTDYILDAAKEQLQVELGKNISLYPVELLADRFLSEDLDLYKADLKKFLRDPRYFAEDEFEDIADFLRDIQENKSPEYKRSCGNKLWRFYTEYKKVTPHIAMEAEDVLKHVVEAILAEGYSGILLVLDEVSLFMMNRMEDQRWDDAKTLVVLANRLAKVHNLPLWTVCSAQQAIEAKMGQRNIIADDRLKLVKLLEEDKDYYDIVLARVREIKDPGATGNYYLHYKRGFTWPNSIGEQEFGHFFPFHKPALEVLRAITYELTTTRSAIHFMHQTLKYQIKNRGRELIRLWELFDEAVRYEEDPSGVHAGLTAIKTSQETAYKAYEACKRQIDGMTSGYLKVYRDKAIKTVQTLFLYHIAKTKQQGLTPEEIANSVLIERDADSPPNENIQHYETLAENLKKELGQIAHTYDEDGRPRYRFDPIIIGIDPRDEFKKARDLVESNEAQIREAWERLLGLDEWPVRTRQMTIDLSSGIRSIFRDIAPSSGPSGDQLLEVNWNGRMVSGLIGMRDLGRVASENLLLPAINSDQTDHDFAVFVGIRPASSEVIQKLIDQRKDNRVLLWTPDELNQEERGRLIDFAAYRKLVTDWQGKETEDAVAVINWVANSLQTDLGKIVKIIDNSYARGRIDALDNSRMEFHVAGELLSILTPLVGRALNGTYESREIKFEPPFIFRKEEGVKVINGVVKTGRIPKGAKPNQNINAAQNFGFGLKIIKKGAEKELDLSDNPYVQSMWTFINEKLADEGASMKMETVYKNFMGLGIARNYGLTRRMVQIYLLGLVQQGKIRVSVSAKSGLPYSLIDYANIAEIDFSAKILDSLAEVQKLAKPENWEILRPYAEKLLGESIQSTHDDAPISQYRAKLRELFRREKDDSIRLVSKIASLFEALKTTNPYENELHQIANLFSTDIEKGDDINQLLFGLKVTLGYQAFDNNAASQSEVDDLAIRLKNYRDLQVFVSYETDIRTAIVYCSHSLPDFDQLKQVRQMQKELAEKLTSLCPYIDSEVKLKTELIGRIPPGMGEAGTLAGLIHNYMMVYITLHDSVMDRLEEGRRQIQTILTSKDIRALRIFELITALQPAVAADIEQKLAELSNSIPTCLALSRASLEEQLKFGPVHECGMSFYNASEWIETAEEIANRASEIFDTAMNRKMEVFLNSTVRQRLEQGEAEKVIEGFLKCQNIAEIRTYLIEKSLEDETIVDTINRYLKRIEVKKVKMADFKPSLSTVEKNQLASLAQEFQKYLENQIESMKADDDTLPMLQVE